MNHLVLKEYLGKGLIFTDDGWINATQTAKELGKKGLENFMRSNEFVEYQEQVALLRCVKFTDLKKVIVGKGKEQGTYLHPFLVVAFARWISPKFAVWCDKVIYDILTGELEIRYKNLQKSYEELEDKAFDRYELIRLFQRP